MEHLVFRFAKDDSGATAVEYVLLAALIAGVIIGSITSIGRDLSGQFSKIANKIGAP